MNKKVFYLNFKFESKHAGDFEYLYSDDDGHYLSVRPGFHEDEYRFISKGDFHYAIQEYKEKHSGHHMYFILKKDKGYVIKWN